MKAFVYLECREDHVNGFGELVRKGKLYKFTRPCDYHKGFWRELLNAEILVIEKKKKQKIIDKTSHDLISWEKWTSHLT